MAKTKGLSGIGNVLPHQYIISDLIFAVRKKLVKNKKQKEFSALSEISISELGYPVNPKNFVTNHNIDFVVIETETQDIVFLAEIERNKKTIAKTKFKIFDCLLNMPTIKEVYIIYVDELRNTKFELCTVLNNKLICKEEVNSRSKFLGLTLNTSFVSLK